MGFNSHQADVPRISWSGGMTAAWEKAKEYMTVEPDEEDIIDVPDVEED